MDNGDIVFLLHLRGVLSVVHFVLFQFPKKSVNMMAILGMAGVNAVIVKQVQPIHSIFVWKKATVKSLRLLAEIVIVPFGQELLLF